MSLPQDTFVPDHSKDYWSCDEDDSLYQTPGTHSRTRKEVLLHVNSVMFQLFDTSEKEH